MVRLSRIPTGRFANERFVGGAATSPNAPGRAAHRRQPARARALRRSGRRFSSSGPGITAASCWSDGRVDAASRIDDDKRVPLDPRNSPGRPNFRSRTSVSHGAHVTTAKGEDRRGDRGGHAPRARRPARPAAGGRHGRLGWEHLRLWLSARVELKVGPLSSHARSRRPCRSRRLALGRDRPRPIRARSSRPRQRPLTLAHVQMRKPRPLRDRWVPTLPRRW